MSNVTVPLEAQGVHAHRCEYCAKSGKMVYWIHKNNCRGVTQAHKCPECGNVEWRAALIEPASIPRRPQPAQNDTGLETFINYSLLFVALALIGYAAYLYYKKMPKELQ